MLGRAGLEAGVGSMGSLFYAQLYGTAFQGGRFTIAQRQVALNR
jgi:hypothetical protein